MHTPSQRIFFTRGEILSELMKHLILDTSKEFRGGQQQICYMAPGLVERKLDVTVCVRPLSPLHEKMIELKVPVILIDPLFEGSPAAVLKLAGEIKKNGFTFCNAQSSHDHTLAWFASALVNPKPKLVVTRRVDFSPGSGIFNRRKYRRGADHYIAISGAIADVLNDYGLSRDQISVIHSSVTPVEKIPGARDAVIARHCLPADSILVGDVASLVDHKGHKYLLEAFPKVIEKLPQARLLLAGDGALRQSLENLCVELGVSKQVRFLGRIDNVAHLLSALDLFVMTSHMEGLCTSILDAMSTHVPVVATAAGGIPEIVRHEQTGLLAQNRDPDSIAENILRALHDNEGSADRAEKAYSMVCNEFGIQTMIDKTAQLYQELTRS